MKVVFMGTPDISATCLRRLVEEKFDVIGVYTKPDMPKNRGMKLVMSETKTYAISQGLPVYQPASFRDDAVVEELRSLAPDVIAVVAYGKILPQRVLDIPKYGCINIHASLLPKYRGAAPIQKCIIDGETKSGVTTMLMEKGLDTGDMLMSEEVLISPEMTAGELHDKLAAVGGELILKTLAACEDGTLTPAKQDDSLSCYAGMISKEMCRIDFSLPAKNVYDFIRGMSPSPCAYTFIGDKRLKVYFAVMTDCTSDKPCGTLIDEEKLTVVCGDGKCISFTEVQGEGGRRMDASSFVNGFRPQRGIILG